MRVTNAAATDVTPAESDSAQLRLKTWPSFLTTNANGLCVNTKQTELALLLHRYGIDVAVITETHLNKNVPDVRIFQTGYSTLRRDRNFAAVNKSKGGGIIIYVKRGLQYIEPNICVPDDLEVCWCVLKPTLPESIIVAGVYIPPDTSASRRRAIADHIIESVDNLRSARSRAKSVILGDFNNLFDVNSLALQLNLKQIVTEKTRGTSVIDLILTDYDTQDIPSTVPAIGTSDHSTVIWVNSEKKKVVHQYRILRPLKESSIRHFGQWICAQDWVDITSQHDVNIAAETLEQQLQAAYEELFPEVKYRCKINDPPWMTKRLKQLINLRNRAHSRRQLDRLRQLRDMVRSEISSAKTQWYKQQMDNIASDKGASWYKQVSKLTNRQPKPWNLEAPEALNSSSCAERINQHFTQICTSYEPLRTDQLPSYLPAQDIPFKIHPWQVAHSLTRLREQMAVPVGQLPVRLLKEFSVELAVPLAHIFNSSLKQGLVPSVWKRATITPVAKKVSPTSPGDLRPLSLTPTFSKVLEHFIVPLILDDIKANIDIRQYGNMRGSSTSHYLIRLIHDLLSQLDRADKLFSVIMYDFKKGFDLIDHTTVMRRLLDMGLRPAYARWLSSFLQDRHQRVKMPDGSLSSWKPITCGTPQGTLVGPVAFLAMVNGAAAQAQNRLKYVDDLTVYEACSVDDIQTESRLQQMTDQLCEWADENKMVLNIDKCQIMHFFTAKKPIVLPNVTIHGTSVPTVNQTKLLGVTISNDMTWQAHVAEMVSKGSRALYMLYVMKRFRPPQEQMVKIYITYIRPLLEYCAPVFHASLSAKQAQQIEKVQKRALKMIAGYDTSYQQILCQFNLETLADRRQKLCLRLGKQMLTSSAHRDLLPKFRGSISGKKTRRRNTLETFRCGARLRKSSIPLITSLINSDILSSK